jgi:hypothetical protein
VAVDGVHGGVLNVEKQIKRFGKPIVAKSSSFLLELRSILDLTDARSVDNMTKNSDILLTKSKSCLRTHR